MEVILLQDVDKLGIRGQIVNVANGYGRNYLLPHKIAVEATFQNRKWAEQQHVKFIKQTAKEKSEAEELAALIAQVSLSFRRKAGEQGQLFGSVTAMDVSESLAAQGYKIDRRKIQLNPVKLLGEYDVPIRLHRDVTATMKVKIEAEAEAHQTAASPSETSEPPAASKEPAATE